MLHVQHAHCRLDDVGRRRPLPRSNKFILIFLTIFYLCACGKLFLLTPTNLKTLPALRDSYSFEITCCNPAANPSHLGNGQNALCGGQLRGCQPAVIVGRRWATDLVPRTAAAFRVTQFALRCANPTLDTQGPGWRRRSRLWRPRAPDVWPRRCHRSLRRLRRRRSSMHRGC